MIRTLTWYPSLTHVQDAQLRLIGKEAALATLQEQMQRLSPRQRSSALQAAATAGMAAVAAAQVGAPQLLLPQHAQHQEQQNVQQQNAQGGVARTTSGGVEQGGGSRLGARSRLSRLRPAQLAMPGQMVMPPGGASTSPTGVHQQQVNDVVWPQCCASSALSMRSYMQASSWFIPSSARGADNILLLWRYATEFPLHVAHVAGGGSVSTGQPNRAPQLWHPFSSQLWQLLGRCAPGCIFVMQGCVPAVVAPFLFPLHHHGEGANNAGVHLAVQLW
jgi:hypothetical protein